MCDFTNTDEFRATHEIGHVLVMEQKNIDWKYVTLLSNNVMVKYFCNTMT